MVVVHNFSYGLFNPVLGYVMSCLGAFLGLRCVTRARAYTGSARARWLALAALSIGATGIWVMHFIAMLGFTITGQEIDYNVPITVASLLIVVVVVGAGLFIVGFGDGSRARLLVAGLIVGGGAAIMHYLGMMAMRMPDSMHYNIPLVIASVLIAIVAGTAALWAGTRVRTVRATIGASLIMGAAVSGMHYTGMAAMRLTPGSMPVMGGAAAISFLIPLLVGISLLTFVLTLTLSLAPTEDEIYADAALRYQYGADSSAAARAAGQRPSASWGSRPGHSPGDPAWGAPGSYPAGDAVRDNSTPASYSLGDSPRGNFTPASYEQDGSPAGGGDGNPTPPLPFRRPADGDPR